MSSVTEPVTTRTIFAEKIRSKTARVGIFGSGYLGLPLGVEKAAIIVEARNALRGVVSEKILL
jgi:hypothetical protein